MASLEAATSVRASSSHTYEADFSEQWCIGAVPHGGFVTACFMQVAKAHFAGTLAKQKQPHTITLHLDFVRRTQTGPATFTVKDVKLGRMTSTIHVTLTQDGREEVLGYISNSDIASEDGVTFDTRWSLEPTPSPASIEAMVNNNDSTWKERKEMPFAEFRKASSQVRFFFPKEGQPMPSFADQWMCFKNGEKFTNTSLGFVADMFPQIPEVYRSDTDPYSIKAEEEHVDTESQARNKGLAKFWYPTLLLNLDVKKALPKEGVDWLFVRTRAKQIKNGRYDLEIVILDEAGDIVALSHHVCMVLSAERNLAKRTSKSDSKGSKL